MSPEKPLELRASYDFIVCGGGTAGCVALAPSGPGMISRRANACSRGELPISRHSATARSSAWTSR